MTATPAPAAVNVQQMQNMPQLLIDNMAVTYIGKLMSQTNMSVFSLKTVAKVLLILSIDEIRNGVKDAIILGKKYAPTAFKYLWNKILLLVLLTKQIQLPFRKTITPLPSEPIYNRILGSCFNFEWKNCQVYSKMIYNQITQNKKCTFNKSYGTKIDSVEYGKNIYTIDYHDIKIPIDNDTFLEIDKISFKSDMTFQETTKMDCLSDYMEEDNEFVKILKLCKNTLFDRFRKTYPEIYKYGENTLIQLDGSSIICNYKITDPTKPYFITNNNTRKIEETCLHYIMKSYPELDARKVYIELQLIMYHKYSYIKDFVFCQLKDNKLDSSWGHYFVTFLSQIKIHTLNLSKILTFNNIGLGNINQMNEFQSKIHSIAISIAIDKNINNENITDEKKMNVKITSPIQYSDQELVQKFIQYLESNNSNDAIIQGKEIHIYELKLSIKKNITKTDNPEYLSWKEFQLEIEAKRNPDDKQNKYDNIISRPPPQFIESVTIEKEIIKTDINEAFKSMDTLYLPHNVSTSLIKILNNFMNKKSGLFTRLGIPNKLGICLYGKPGTGKSTTIKVIGSYLGKDIYYINMNGITKNSELKLMFDFVIRKQCEGGIIVFEDLDCACSIVKPRQNPTSNPFQDNYDSRMANIVDSDELSLSYLLNLLDGTLCAKNTMFIITTNHIDHLDRAIIRPGRCDITIELKDCDRYQIKRIWESVMENQLDEEILNSIPEYKFTPAELIFHLIEYIYQDKVSPQEIFDSLSKKLEKSY
jgi:hypothetical protein